MMQIRNEQPADYAHVEALTRRAFYNVYMPGCFEHYLVRVMRGHADFVPELAFVLELDGEIAGSILYTRARLTDEEGHEKTVLTFGPLCVAPEHQRRGYGRMLMERSFERAIALGYDAIVIFGSPANYVGRGFRGCKAYNVCVEGGRFPAAMLVKALVPGALDGRRWVYRESPAMTISPEDAARYDDTLPPMEKKHTPSQEEFAILSRAFVE